MKKGKNNPVWNVIVKCILAVLLACVILAAVIIVPLWLMLKIDTWKHERQLPQVRELAESYLVEQYPGNDFEITDVYHHWYDAVFNVEVQSQSSADTHFTVVYDDDPLEFLSDSYERDVLEGGNTADRVEEEYSAAVQAVLSDVFPEQKVDAKFQRRYYVPGDAEITEDMLANVRWEVDKQYDVSALGTQAGVVMVYFDNTEGQYPLERRLDVLRQMAQALEEADMGFFTMEVWLAEELHNDSPAYCFEERIPKTELD